MKTIKTLFAIVILSTFFIACEADATNDEIGIENIDVLGEDGEEDIKPSLVSADGIAKNVNFAREDGDEDIQPDINSSEVKIMNIASEDGDEDVQP